MICRGFSAAPVEQVLLTPQWPERPLLTRSWKDGWIARGARFAIRAGMSRSRVPPPKALEVEHVGAHGEFVLISWPVNLAAKLEPLTPSERDVLLQVVLGATNAQIARRRGTSPRTVANQMARLLEKLEAGSRYELIRRFGGSRAKP